MGLVTENGVLPNYCVSNVLFLHIVQTEFCQHFIFEVELSSIILLHFIFTVLNSLTVCVSLSSISHALFWQEKKKKEKICEKCRILSKVSWISIDCSLKQETFPSTLPHFLACTLFLHLEVKLSSTVIITLSETSEDKQFLQKNQGENYSQTYQYFMFLIVTFPLWCIEFVPSSLLAGELQAILCCCFRQIPKQTSV